MNEQSDMGFDYDRRQVGECNISSRNGLYIYGAGSKEGKSCKASKPHATVKALRRADSLEMLHHTNKLHVRANRS